MTYGYVDPFVEGLCECGHPPEWHVRLPGHPDGAEECQAEDCACGRFRLASPWEDLTQEVIEGRKKKPPADALDAGEGER